PYSANEWRIPYDYNQDGDLEDRWFNVVCSPLREPDGLVSGFVAMATEATEQVRARQELELINRGLEDFASVASHDLQEPLRMIKIHSQFLVRRLGSSATEEHKRIADLIQRGVGRMERLIKDLLSYSRSAHPSSELPARVVNLEEELREAMGE